ncbi:Putative hydrolase (plasmid) [Sodalis praecaptivus]|uniref:Putative hydrolase n=1 Tax=Sodalis praecaptivus TaxID=1239307 RepID=W0I3L2_9GAMM|nr:hypothetical protein [Sodalis praecaptivus]AHF79060.1 Putative hydrolase [Sodalis praecaptivus]
MKITALLLVFIVMHSHAVNIHPIVYRADSRKIADISAAGGMFPWGLDHLDPDTDLIHHFEGESLEERGSVFVSTSSSLAQVIQHASSLARPNSEEPYDHSFVTYIYAIRPTQDFYDVEASILNRRNALPNESPLRTRLDRLLHDYGGMEELVAVNGIPFDRIIGFIRIDGNMLNRYGVSPGSPLLSETHWSNRWERAGTRYETRYNIQGSSPQPYPIVAVNAEPTGSRRVVRNGTERDVPLSFSCKGVGEHGAKRSKRALARACRDHQTLTLSSEIYDRGLFLALTDTVP